MEIENKKLKKQNDSFNKQLNHKVHFYKIDKTTEHNKSLKSENEYLEKKRRDFLNINLEKEYEELNLEYSNLKNKNEDLNNRNIELNNTFNNM